jgi:hypothetical protein
MEGDPTGGMWIYLIFLIIPLARILPRMLRKYRRKNAGLEPEPLKYSEEPPKESQPKPDKKDGWVGKDDFK